VQDTFNQETLSSLKADKASRRAPFSVLCPVAFEMARLIRARMEPRPLQNRAKILLLNPGYVN
jgi:hypothetical protein